MGNSTEIFPEIFDPRKMDPNFMEDNFEYFRLSTARDDDNSIGIVRALFYFLA